MYPRQRVMAKHQFLAMWPPNLCFPTYKKRVIAFLSRGPLLPATSGFLHTHHTRWSFWIAQVLKGGQPGSLWRALSDLWPLFWAGEGLWQGAQGALTFSRHLPQRVPLLCRLETGFFLQGQRNTSGRQHGWLEAGIGRTGSRPDPGARPWGAAQRDFGANITLSVYSGVSSLELPRKQLCEWRENM